MLFTCMLCGMTGFALFAEAPSAAIFVVGIPFLSFWGLVSPAMQSFMMLAWNRYSALRGLRHADRRCRLTRKKWNKVSNAKAETLAWKTCDLFRGGRIARSRRVTLRHQDR